jgi:two-component system chemotaxis response regulator CheB
METSTTLSSPVVSVAEPDLIRVMVVDDSAVIRGLITRSLQSEPGIRVILSAANGELAIQKLKKEPVDVVILDIEMPVMDGLTAIPKIKEVDPAVQIVMASTLTHKNAEVSLKALSLGATDYISKPTSTLELTDAQGFQRELLEKVKELGIVARRRGVRRPSPDALVSVAPPPVQIPAEKKAIILRPMPKGKPDIIAIGSSTGGPQALLTVIRAMGGELQQPVVVTQHMPPSFTTILADNISKQCNVTCVEAKDGDVLQPKKYYIAPGDFHMLFTRKPEGIAVKLTKDAQENFCRPAVDPMLRALVEFYGNRILSVILTGMGQDGCNGGKAVVTAGGAVIAQDEATSVVWGMPGAVATAGLCSAVLPLSEIGQTVQNLASGARL